MSRFLLIFLLLGSANVYASINKWVDEQGHVHYSDQVPPPKVQAKNLPSTSEVEGSASSVAGTETPSASQSFVEQEAALKREQLAKQAAVKQVAQKQATTDALKANCDNARKNLLSLQSGVRMMDIKPNGERYFINDAERQQRIAKAQQGISHSCK